MLSPPYSIRLKVFGLLILCVVLSGCIRLPTWDRNGGENAGSWVLGKSIPLGK